MEQDKPTSDQEDRSLKQINKQLLHCILAAFNLITDCVVTNQEKQIPGKLIYPQEQFNL